MTYNVLSGTVVNQPVWWSIYQWYVSTTMAEGLDHFILHTGREAVLVHITHSAFVYCMIITDI